MDATLSILTGGNSIFIALMGGLFAALIAWIRGRASGARSERDRARAKEADAYEQHLKDISGAHDARNRIDPDRVPDRDKYRRG